MQLRVMCWDSQWTRGVEGSQVGRQHVFPTVETVQRRRRNAPWSRRAEGKTTSTSLSVGVTAALTVGREGWFCSTRQPDKQPANQGGQADRCEQPRPLVWGGTIWRLCAEGSAACDILQCEPEVAAETARARRCVCHVSAETTSVFLT